MAEEQIIEVANLVNDKLASLPRSSSRPCIFKIPQHILEVNEKAYRATIISIGPIHCQEPHLQLQATQELKSQLLQCFLQATSARCSLEEYLRFLRDNEGKARNYYAESVSLSSNDFILMLLIDAVFVINYLMWCHRSNISESYCPGVNLIEERIDIGTHVRRDFFLEDNQLPFFVLQRIYDMSFGTNYSDVSFTDVTCSFVFYCFNSENKVNSFESIKERVKNASNIKNLVDFLRICFLPSTLREHLPPIAEHSQFCSNVHKLQAAGVRFEATKSKNLLDITFNKGVLKIPKFIVQDTTESIYRSILAFEQCHAFFDSYFTDYIFFLDSLIKTPEDVRILVRRGIIDNWLGSDDSVADLFNNITKNITLYAPQYYYSDVTKRLVTHTSMRCNRWKAILKRDYFSHPWSIISVIAAFILLILTLLQTIGTFVK